MVLPTEFHAPSTIDPIVVTPLPSFLPESPLASLPPLLSHVDKLLSAPSGSRHHISPAALGSRMNQLNRDAYTLLNAARLDAATSRAELDRTDTLLRGVEYERNRIREEIERCMEYVPAYPSANLPSTEDFLGSASEEVKGGLPEETSEEYEYAIIIAKLEQELKDIEAREAEVEALTKDRDSLVKAKKEVKYKYDSTDSYLAEYIRTTNVLLNRLKAPLELNPPTLSAFSSEPLPAADEDDRMDA